MAGLKFRDKDGVVHEVLLLRGPQGPAGGDGGYYEPVIDQISDTEVEYWFRGQGGLEDKLGGILQLPRGPAGPAGPEGPQGPAGRGIDSIEMPGDGTMEIHFTDGNIRVFPLPAKGTDYFTEADKQELVADVLEALPVWEGGSY